MAPSKFSPELPLELLCEIVKSLPLTDLQTISLASRLTRSLALPFIFGHLRYTGDVLRKLHKIYQARKDVKEVIKKLELQMYYSVIGIYESLFIFQFLETLPNLQVLLVTDLASPYLSQFISSIRHTSLLELSLSTDWEPVEGPPAAGPPGLEKLSIPWYAFDNQDERGSSLAHMYELIRPTLTTLVELRIDIMNYKLGDFDLQILKPSADTLRTFEYTLQSGDENILDTIPTILPHLTKLSIKWSNTITHRHSILWKDAHIQAVSKNDNLTHLKLSSDFEVNAQDTAMANNDYACLARSYKRRLKATRDIVSVCPRLQRCSWVQMIRNHFEVSHSFVVEERMTGGNLSRVVRGIKQGWMGRDHNTQYRGGGIVKCKIEDLPGDIIGRNDVE